MASSHTAHPSAACQSQLVWYGLCHHDGAHNDETLGLSSLLQNTACLAHTPGKHFGESRGRGTRRRSDKACELYRILRQVFQEHTGRESLRISDTACWQPQFHREYVCLSSCHRRSPGSDRKRRSRCMRTSPYPLPSRLLQP